MKIMNIFPNFGNYNDVYFLDSGAEDGKGCLASKIFMHFGQSRTSKDVFINTKVCFNLFGKQICLKVHTIDANE